MNVQAAQLFQDTPSVTTDNVIFTASINTEILRIIVCNTTGSAATFRLFHDDDGTTLSTATALYYDVSIPANDVYPIFTESPSSGISMAPGASLGFATGTADALTITGYGQTWVGR